MERSVCLELLLTQFGNAAFDSIALGFFLDRLEQFSDVLLCLIVALLNRSLAERD